MSSSTDFFPGTTRHDDRRSAAPVAHDTPQRAFAWLAVGLATAFLVPFVVADRLGAPRDAFIGVHLVAVTALFAGWAHDTGRSIRALLHRRWPYAVGLGLVFAGLSWFLATRADVAGPHPDGPALAWALAWRGMAYGAADGLLLSAFPILTVAAAFSATRLRRRRGGVLAVGAAALAASVLMTGVYHLGFADYRSAKLRKPVAGDLVWSVPTLLTLNPVGAPIAHVGLHVGAILHNSDTDLFLPPHD